LKERADTFVKFLQHPQVWGLVGQVYEKPKRERPARRPLLAVLRDALLEHGPLSEFELCGKTGIDRAYINRLLNRNKGDWFCIVSKGYVGYTNQITCKWGVVGVHGGE
jgi:hypothetical protein